MATAGVAVRKTGGLGAFAVLAYLVLMGLILFSYLRALFQLLPVRERLMGATEILSAPVMSLQGLVIVLALMVLGLVFYKQFFRLMILFPVGVRGLLIPLPIYFLLTRNQMVTAVLAAMVVVVWLLYGVLAKMFTGLLKSVPTFVVVPLSRFWPAMIYAVVFAGSILPAVSAILVMWSYHYLDNAVEWLFLPVWNWCRALPTRTWMSLFVARLIVGVTCPFVLSYSMAWWNPGFERTSLYNAAVVSLVTYFIIRMPRGAPQGEVAR